MIKLSRWPLDWRMVAQLRPSLAFVFSCTLVVVASASAKASINVQITGGELWARPLDLGVPGVQSVLYGTDSLGRSYELKLAPLIHLGSFSTAEAGDQVSTSSAAAHRELRGLSLTIDGVPQELVLRYDARGPGSVYINGDPFTLPTVPAGPHTFSDIDVSYMIKVLLDVETYDIDNPTYIFSGVGIGTGEMDVSAYESETFGLLYGSEVMHYSLSAAIPEPGSIIVWSLVGLSVVGISYKRRRLSVANR